MRICGVEIKGSEAVIAVVDMNDDHIELIEVEPKKIVLQNDEDPSSVKSFFETFAAFTRDNQVKKIHPDILNTGSLRCSILFSARIQSEPVNSAH